MNALDSPLALNYLTYGFFTAVNKMLAAFSFWRWRIGPSSLRGRTKDAATTSCAPPVLEREVADEPAKAIPSNCLSENSTKGKFVFYHRNDGSREGGAEAVDGDDDDGVAATAGSEKFRRWSDMGWERKMEIRMREMGWYRCQDLAAFNGSVVRLWDGRSRVCATAG